ncbi:MAG: glycosyltransferase family 9 protein [bacterium]
MNGPGSDPTPDGGPIPKRVLILQTAFLGDVVLTLPLVKRAHELWPDTQLIPLTLPSTASIFEDHPGVVESMTWDKHGADRGLFGMLRIAREIRSRNVDLALIPHRSFRSALLMTLAGVKRRIGFAHVPGSPLYTHRVFRDEEAHEGAKNLSLLGQFDTEISPKPVLATHPQAAAEVKEWMKKEKLAGDNIIAIAPGSVWATKRWPETYWVVLARKLKESGHSAVFVGGPEDRELSLRIREAALGENIHVSAGELSVRGSSELLRFCRLLITNDTAPLHLAVAVQTPVLAIFGPTLPEFGFAPTGPSDRIVGLDLECRGCAIHGSDRCPLGHHDCMVRLLPAEIYSIAVEMLEETA